MKKLYILMILIFVQQLSFSQFAFITPKAGITLSNARNFIFEKENYKPGFLIGCEFEYRLSTRLSLKPGLIFEQKGTFHKEDIVDINGHPSGIAKEYYTWNYIGIPMLIKYQPFATNRIYIQCGGYADFLTSEIHRIMYTEAGDPVDIKEHTNISGYGKLDAGLLAGVGIEIPVGRNALQFDARYAYAFNIGGALMPPATNTFSLSVGYAFKLRE